MHSRLGGDTARGPPGSPACMADTVPDPAGPRKATGSSGRREETVIKRTTRRRTEPRGNDAVEAARGSGDRPRAFSVS